MTTVAKETGQNLDTNPNGVAHERLFATVTVKQPGYIYIYFSNEETDPVEVYFDDFKVTQTKSPVVGMEDYYPFGLAFNSYSRENSVENKFRFQGQEHVDDLNLGWDAFKWRNHQPEIGRFFNVDPLADKYVYNSPYAFSENHVVAHRELEGLEKVSIQQTLGNNYNFYRAYNLQRQTTGGQEVSKLIAGQSKINVFYYVYKGGWSSGQTFKATNLEDFRKRKAVDGTLQSLSDKEVEQAMDGNELLFIGIEQSALETDERGENAAFTLNHEEVAHGESFLKGTFKSAEDDHAKFYGGNWFATISPSNSAVKSNPRFNNSKAREQLSQITRMIDQAIRAAERKEARKDRKQEREAQKK
jgi:RHS repeat-associated protein